VTTEGNVNEAPQAIVATPASPPANPLEPVGAVDVSAPAEPVGETDLATQALPDPVITPVVTESPVTESPPEDGEVPDAAPERPRRRSATLTAIRTMPEGLAPHWRRLLVATVVAQVLMVIVVSLVAAFEFHVWSPIDEEAHYSYIQQVAEHGSLPVLGRTPTSQQGLAISQGIYPLPNRIPLHTLKLSEYSYEAFQPPLYYFAAVPAFDSTSNYLYKVYAVRLFGVALFLASLVLTARLARVVLGDRWLIGWSIVLLFFSLPGVVIRMVTISPEPLSLLLGVLFTTELWIAWQRHSPRRLLVAAVLAGLCALTEFELVALFPVLALVAVAELTQRIRANRQPRAKDQPRRSPQTIALVMLSLVVPVVVIAPWLAYNEATYHLLNAGSIAIKEQTYLVNPRHTHFPIRYLPDDTAVLINPVLPAEWVNAFGANPSLQYLGSLLAIMVGPAGLFVILGMGRRLWSIRWAVLGLPVLMMLAVLLGIRYVEQWGVQSRYAFAAVPGFLILVAEGCRDTFRKLYLPVIGTSVASAGVLVIWLFMFFSYRGPLPI